MTDFPGSCSSVVTTGFPNVSFPFYYWPENITVADKDTELELLCVVHGCNRGPYLVVKGYSFKAHNNELVESQCKVVPNKSYEDGIWFLRMKATLNEVGNHTNIVVGTDEEIPVFCRTTMDSTATSYIRYVSRQTTTDGSGTQLDTDCMNSNAAVSNSETFQTLPSAIAMITGLMMSTYLACR